MQGFSHMLERITYSAVGKLLYLNNFIFLVGIPRRTHSQVLNTISDQLLPTTFPSIWQQSLKRRERYSQILTRHAATMKILIHHIDVIRVSLQ